MHVDAVFVDTFAGAAFLPRQSQLCSRVQRKAWFNKRIQAHSSIFLDPVDVARKVAMECRGSTEADRTAMNSVKSDGTLGVSSTRRVWLSVLTKPPSGDEVQSTAKRILTVTRVMLSTTSRILVQE